MIILYIYNIRNIPYSTGHTIYRIASEIHEYEISKGQYTDFLKARDYSAEVIQEAFDKLETKNRISYLEPNVKHEHKKQVFPLVSDFNPALPNVGAILNKHKHILHLDSELTKVIDPSNIFPSYRGAKTLRDLLIYSKLPVLGEELLKKLVY